MAEVSAAVSVVRPLPGGRVICLGKDVTDLFGLAEGRGLGAPRPIARYSMGTARRLLAFRVGERMATVCGLVLRWQLGDQVGFCTVGQALWPKYPSPLEEARGED